MRSRIDHAGRSLRRGSGAARMAASQAVAADLMRETMGAGGRPGYQALALAGLLCWNGVATAQNTPRLDVPHVPTPPEVVGKMLEPATVVTLYLLPGINLRLRPQLWQQLKVGTRVVSHDFNMGEDWPPEKVETIGNKRIYYWTITGANSKAAKP